MIDIVYPAFAAGCMVAAFMIPIAIFFMICVWIYRLINGPREDGQKMDGYDARAHADSGAELSRHGSRKV